MLYRVLARTKRTDWVEMNAFDGPDGYNEALALAREISQSDAGTETMVEPVEQASDRLHK